MYSLRQAAFEVKKSKSTLLRAINAGKLSAKRDENGGWLIDPSELHRVYEPPNEADEAVHEAVDEMINDADMMRHESILLRELLAEKDQRLADKETTIQSLEAVINDLMVRLDAETEERRRLTVAFLPSPSNKRSWWPWK